MTFPVQVFRCPFSIPGILYLPVSICLEFSLDLHRLGGKIQLASTLHNNCFTQNIFWPNQNLSTMSIRQCQYNDILLTKNLTKSNSHWIGFTSLAVRIILYRWISTFIHCTINIRVSNQSRINSYRWTSDQGKHNLEKNQLGLQSSSSATSLIRGQG